jgi:hypothetical protein
MWYRVFGSGDGRPEPDAVLAHLEQRGCAVRADFRGDENGWLQAQFVFAASTPIYVERFLATEEGIRAELNTWAAYLETCDYSPHFAQLMERVVQTRQLFTIRQPMDASNEALVETICSETARYLARTTEGVYQIDRQGFFEADGTLLLQEY